jgi:hypothetical protein
LAAGEFQRHAGKLPAARSNVKGSFLAQQGEAKVDCVEAAQRVTLHEAFCRAQAFGGDFNDVKPVPFLIAATSCTK